MIFPLSYLSGTVSKFHLCSQNTDISFYCLVDLPTALYKYNSLNMKLLRKLKYAFLHNEEKLYHFRALLFLCVRRIPTSFCFHQIQNVNGHLTVLDCMFQNATYFTAFHASEKYP